MYNITLIGTYHEKNGICNHFELYKIMIAINTYFYIQSEKCLTPSIPANVNKYLKTVIT